MKNTTDSTSKKRITIIASAVAAVILLVGLGIFIGGRNQIVRNIKDGEIVAASKYGKVYKEDVTEALQAMSMQTGNEMKFEDLTKDQLETIISSIVAQRGVLEEAKNSDVIKDPQFQKGISTLVENLTKETYLREMAKPEITEEKMKTRYDQIAKEMKGKKEYRVRHILVETREEANQILTTLTKLNFAEVASKKSLDKASAVRGGDLGTVLLSNFDEQFAKALEKQPVGTISKPIKTKFGWHIILVESSRPAVVPPYEESKGKLQDALFGEFVRNYLLKVAEKSEIKYLPNN